jgi:hypothetical protein
VAGCAAAGAVAALVAGLLAPRPYRVEMAFSAVAPQIHGAIAPRGEVIALLDSLETARGASDLDGQGIGAAEVRRRTDVEAGAGEAVVEAEARGATAEDARRLGTAFFDTSVAVIARAEAERGRPLAVPVRPPGPAVRAAGSGLAAGVATGLGGGLLAGLAAVAAAGRARGRSRAAS